MRKLETDLPLISIITICFNEGIHLEETILSIINQTYSNFEFIIIDGGSIDGSIEIIEKYESHISYWVSEKDNGIYDAWNKGILVSHGEYINYMPGGDMFANNFVIEKVISEMKKFKNKPDVIFGDIKIIDTNIIRKSEALNYIKKGIPFCPLAMFIKKTILEKHKFDIKFKICADYNLIVTMYLQKNTFFYFEDIILLFRGGGISSRPSFLKIKEDFKVQRRIPFNLYAYTNFIIRSFIYVKMIVKNLIKKMLGI